MQSLSKTRLTLAASCVIASLWFNPAHAQVSPAELAAQKEQHLQTIRTAQEELVSVQQKIKESEAQLKDLREELSARQVQMAGLKRELGAAPSDSDERVLANESRRVTMAELAVKAREAGLERLEAKQSELQQDITTAQTAVTRTDRRLQNAARAAEDAKRQAAADAAAQELAERQRLEAEAAEQVLIEQRNAEEAAARIAAEQEKAANARLEAERAAAAAATAAPVAEPARDAGAGKTTTRSQRPPSRNERLRPGEAPPDMSLVVLEGEEPIFSGDDGGQVIMRSRSIPDSLVMREVAPEQFSAEVEVTPGRAYFDVGARRYRGVFPDQPGNNRYRFHYDRTDPLKPTLRIFKN